MIESLISQGSCIIRVQICEQSLKDNLDPISEAKNKHLEINNLLISRKCGSLVNITKNHSLVSTKSKIKGDLLVYRYHISIY